MTRKILGTALVLTLLVLTLLVLTLLASAGNGQQSVPVLETPFYPLKTGNTWVYRSGKQKVTVRVDRVEPLDFKKGDKVEKVPAHKLVITKDDREKAEYVAVLADGVYRFAGDGKEQAEPMRFFKLPLKKGESWQIDTTLDGMTLKGSFVASEEDVTVPADTFKTMTVTGKNIRIGNQTMNVEYWFAPAVGIVKQSIKVGTDEEVVLELEKFTPAK